MQRSQIRQVSYVLEPEKCQCGLNWVSKGEVEAHEVG